MRCDSKILGGSQSVLHVDVGEEPEIRAPLLRLGADCSGKGAKCARGLRCKDSLCRKIGLSPEELRLRKSIHKLKDNIPTFVATESIAAAKSYKVKTDSDKPADASSPGRDAVRKAPQDDYLVTGLSVPLSHRVPMNEVASGATELLPSIKQKIPKHIDIIEPTAESSNHGSLDEKTKNTTCASLNDSVANEAAEPQTTSNAASTASGTEATDTETSETEPYKRVQDGSSEALKNASNDAANASSLDVNEETEDEQIADSVVKVIEKKTGLTVDDKLLSEIDTAVTKAMNSYEDKALVHGDLVINVDNLIKGEGTAEVKMKETEPADEDGGIDDRGDQESQPLHAKQRAQILTEQIFATLRQKVENDMSVDLMNKVTTALMDPKCGNGGNVNPKPDSIGQGQHIKVPCRVVYWLRENWFDRSSGRNPLVQGTTDENTS